MRYYERMPSRGVYVGRPFSLDEIREADIPARGPEEEQKDPRRKREKRAERILFIGMGH